MCNKPGHFLTCRCDVPSIIGTAKTCQCYAALMDGQGCELHDAAKTALRPYTSAERKEMPVQTIMAEYFPDALAAVARHSKKANTKHNGETPMFWAREKSTDHLNCAVRHLMTPDAIDADTGEIELVGAAWRCLAALQLREEARLKAAGIKPLSGITS